MRGCRENWVILKICKNMIERPGGFEEGLPFQCVGPEWLHMHCQFALRNLEEAMSFCVQRYVRHRRAFVEAFWCQSFGTIFKAKIEKRNLRDATAAKALKNETLSPLCILFSPFRAFDWLRYLFAPRKKLIEYLFGLECQWKELENNRNSLTSGFIALSDLTVAK